MTTTPEIRPASDEEIAARAVDWQQVVLNGGPPCFAVEHGPRFCLRAERWMGHKQGFVGTHSFISLETLLATLLAADRARIEELEELYSELQDWIGEQMTPPDVMEATIAKQAEEIERLKSLSRAIPRYR